jgi:anaerobic selenocysteine-containing dehydrogenase
MDDGVDPSDAMTHQTHHTFCRFCEALCGVVVTTEGDRVVEVRGDPEDPLSRGYTCPKGRALGDWHHRPDRLDVPRLRRDGTLQPVDWSELLDDISVRLQEIIAHHGRDAIGIYHATGAAFDSNGRRTVERFRRALGTKSMYTAASIDTPSKQLVAELMSGHPGLFPAPDRERAKLFLFLGVNPVVSHGHLNAFPDPVTTVRGMAESAEVWVVDPRRTETARLATGHLAIRPGTDYALLAYLVRGMLEEGADTGYLERHASDVDRLEEAVAPYDGETAARECGVEHSELRVLLASVRRAGKVAGQTGTGVSMSAAANVSEWLLWALHIVTGSHDQPGGTWFNPGYLKQLDTRTFAPCDGTPGPGPDSRPDIPGRWGEIPCAAMTDEIEAGQVRALIVCGGNPMRAFPDTERVEAALRRLDVLAVADVIETDTTALATHVLPVTGQLERADVPLYLDQFMPSVATRFTPAVVAPGSDRRHLWWAIAALADRLDLDVIPVGLDLETCDEQDLLKIVADRSRSRFEELEQARVLIDAPSEIGWVLDRVVPDGGWRLAPDPLVEQLASLGEPPSLAMIPRRQMRHLNSSVPATQGKRHDQPWVLIHPEDAAGSGVVEGAEIEIRSPTGSLRATARLDENIRPGAISVPHGFGEPNVGRLTSPVEGVDPLTGMVLQSGIPVTIAAV